MIGLLMVPLLLAEELVAEIPAEAVEAPATPDRTAPPAVIPPVVMALPEMSTAVLRPGLTLSHLQVDGVRKIEVMVMFERGSIDLCGMSQDCQAMINIWELASEQTDAVTMAATLDALDGDLYSWMGLTMGGLELTIPRTGLDDGLTLLAEVLRTPALSRKEHRRSTQNALDWYLETGPSDLGQVASSARRFSFYEASHPRGRRVDLRARKAIKRADLRDVHDRLLSSAPVHVLVVGDLTRAEIEPKIVALLDGLGVAGERSTPPVPVPPAASSIVAVDMPGPQAAIRMVTAAPGRGDDGLVAISAADFALGGSFTSRLNSNLREEKGWTYGAGSHYSRYSDHGSWGVSVDVEAENVAGAVHEIRTEIDAMVQDGVTADEVEASWLDDVTGWNRRLETAGSAAGFYQQLILQEASLTRWSERLEAAKGLTGEESRAAAEAWLSPDHSRLWIIVGDRALIEEQVAGMGLPVQWITPSQAIFGEFEVAR